MYCPNCGKQLPDDSNFCKHCGSRLELTGTSSEAALPEDIFLGEDGAYRWVYEINLWKNNAIAGSLLKIMLLLIFVIIVPVLLFQGIDFLSLLLLIPVFLIATAVLVFIGYGISAMINGGKYCAVFLMDETQVVHAQSKKQVTKGRIMAAISTLALNDSATGLSLLASEKFTSPYQTVKTIKIEPDKNLIRVNGTFTKNQIYAYPHQLPFVADYIISRCPHAVVRKS